MKLEDVLPLARQGRRIRPMCPAHSFDWRPFSEAICLYWGDSSILMGDWEVEPEAKPRLRSTEFSGPGRFYYTFGVNSICLYKDGRPQASSNYIYAGPGTFYLEGTSNKDICLMPVEARPKMKAYWVKYPNSFVYVLNLVPEGILVNDLAEKIPAPEFDEK